MTQRSTTEDECIALNAQSSNYVQAISDELHKRWTETASVTAPHQLATEIGDIKGLNDSLYVFPKSVTFFSFVYILEMSGQILVAQQELINRLRDELNRAEFTIQEEIERQTEDLGVMRQRMKEHLDATRSTQHFQLRMIDVNPFFKNKHSNISFKSQRCFAFAGRFGGRLFLVAEGSR